MAAAIAALTAGLAACGTSTSTSSGSGSASPGASAAAATCSQASLQKMLYQPGALTVATDNPVYPPWFIANKPANGKGYESAVAYAINNSYAVVHREPQAGYYSVGAAIWLNIRMFIVAEVLILILALAIALVRQSTSPALFPLRVLAVIYVDFFRGVPLILVIFATGFGVPALELPFISHQPLVVYGVTACRRRCGTSSRRC
jgi:hypothetical protein